MTSNAVLLDLLDRAASARSRPARALALLALAEDRMTDDDTFDAVHTSATYGTHSGGARSIVHDGAPEVAGEAVSTPGTDDLGGHASVPPVEQEVLPGRAGEHPAHARADGPAPAGPAHMPLGAANALLLDLYEQVVGPHITCLADCPTCAAQLQLAFTTADVRGSQPPPLAGPHSVTAGSRRATFRLPTWADLAALADTPGSDGANLLARCVLRVDVTTPASADPTPAPSEPVDTAKAAAEAGVPASGETGADLPTSPDPDAHIPEAALAPPAEPSGQAEAYGEAVIEVEEYGEAVTQADETDEAGIETTVPPSLARAVAEEMERADPMAETRVAVTCDQCGESFEGRFDLVEHLWSHLAMFRVRLLAEVHEIASAYGWSEADILAIPQTRRQSYIDLIRAGVAR
ncbi:hypothetical protein [Sinosporangium siamense]|uniref:C2H2-type domain-containing protein n=1 Tax=Sinosporangium siamense TaxID=1367973 RepID=A0A919RD60_9ACTN|nr:hypothetical protein [Sinosporangium siamense]GII90575.1 hypothetical protein Ssi02_08060 [Sinosporangium siamense]